MCLPQDHPSMMCWLEKQVRVIDAWRDELVATVTDDDVTLERLTVHRAWLTQEIDRLATPTAS